MTEPDPLRATELLAILEEATTSVRHDVRNRIASMRNLAFFVRRKLAAEESPERDPRVGEFLLKIEHEVQRTDEVIEAWTGTVLSVQPLETKLVRAARAVRLGVECARLPGAVSIACAIADETLSIGGDERALALAVRCLLENAAEAVGSGEVRLQLSRELDNCAISVADSGPGISDPKKCLERFESTKPGHLGLGLCLARRIAARSGGDLIIARPPAGAEVILRIPLATDPSPRRELA